MQPDQDGSMGGPQPSDQVAPLASDQATSAPSDKDDKIAKVRKAKVRYDMLMRKDNKSLQDESELKKVSQIIAKNKGIV
jgi:hypothetical protein